MINGKNIFTIKNNFINRMKNRTILGLLIYSFSIFIYPQDEMKFEHLSLQEGVAHNLTNCMMKDSKGFLWFGTKYGLARYEGAGYTIFKHNPEDPASISFDDIISLFEDSKGNIWIGTWGGGLNQYNPYKGEFTRFVYDDKNPDGINDNFIKAICEDKNGDIWIGMERGGLNRFDPETNKFTHYKFEESNPGTISSDIILSLLSDSQGNLWIGTSNSLSRFNYQNNSFENFVYNPGLNNSISPGSVQVIFEDMEKDLWIGTSSGLNLYNGSNGFQKYFSESGPNPLSHNFIFSITEDIHNNLWIGTAYGLNHFDKKNNRLTKFFHNPYDPASISGNTIYNVIEDNSGILWINAYDSGINKTLRKSNFNFFNFEGSSDYTGSLSNNNILSVAEGKDGLLWIGTMNGLNIINPLNWENITKIKVDGTAQNNVVGALATDFDGKIWIGTYNGLKIYSSGRFFEPEFKGLKEAGLFSTRITAFLIDSLTVWIGTYDQGLFMLDRKNNSLSRFSYEGKHFSNSKADYILTVYKDSFGRIWIGSYGGLTIYDEKDNSIKSYTNNLDDNSSLSNNYVFCIFEDSKKELWVCTSNGLNKFVYGSSTFDHFFEKDGLPNSVICSITENFNGELWISTNKGLSKFNSDKKTFTNYDLTDGLGGNLFNPSVCVYGKYTNLVFGGNWGLTMFYPGEMKFSDYNPPVYVSSIKKISKDGESSLLTSFTDEVEISSSEKTIIINFTSLDFSNPVKNKYAYMLEGIDNDWIYAENKKSITYTNLEAGEYILRVRGTNSDGIFSSSLAELKIIVVPPFWQTWWFLLIASLVLVTVVFFIVRSKLNAKIKYAFEIQTIREEESSKVRQQTAIDFHDEIGHRLTRISLLTEMIRKKLHNTFVEIDPLLKTISENSTSLYEGTRDFIWAIDPGHDNLYDLIIRLKDFGDELFDGTKIKFNIKGIDEDLQKFPLNMEWKRHVILIFKEAMNNTLKYSECTNATLEVSVSGQDKIEIFLFDNGQGFDFEKTYEGNGLKNMRIRAEKINGTIDIDSRAVVGTKILFKGIIPYNYLDYNRKVA